MAGPSITHTRVGGASLVHISGAIDEHFDRKALLELAAECTVIDLDQVRKITSYGIREWTHAIKELRGALYFVRCRPQTIAQFNMIANFGGQGQLLSFYAPYLCDACGNETDLLLDMRANAADIRALRPPSSTCPKCQAAMSLDEMAESYFAFAARSPIPQPPSVVDELLQGRSEAPAARLRIAKEVEGDLTVLWLSGELEGNARLKRLAEGLEGTVLVVTDGINACSREGFEALGDFLKATDVPVFLARLPPPVLAHLASQKGAVGMAVVVSAALPATCASCGRPGTVEVDAAARHGAEAHCLSCDGVLAPNPEARATAEKVAFGRAAVDVVEYLRGHAHAPVPEVALGPSATPPEGTPPGLQILRPLGAGGMAEVFLARQQGLRGFEKYVVLKRVLPSLARETKFVEMLFSEARAAARLTHPNIVQIHDVGEINGLPYMIMEYVRGADLRRILSQLGFKKNETSAPLPAEHAIWIASEVAAALDYAHHYVDPTGQAFPVVHRDVSPHNILVGAEGVVKLADFGVAKVVTGGEKSEPGVVKGKADYVSPEAVRGLPLDGRSDLFSLSVVLYEMLTARKPYRRGNVMATFRAIAREVPEDPRSYDATLPEPLVRAVMRGLEKDPANRYASGEQMRRELEAVVAAAGYRPSAARLSDYLREQLAEELGDFSGARKRTGETPTAPERLSKVRPQLPQAPEPSSSATKTFNLAAPAAVEPVPVRPPRWIWIFAALSVAVGGAMAVRSCQRTGAPAVTPRPGR